MSVKRRANGKWYARKKVYSSDKGSIPVDLYIGSDEECTSEKLREISCHFGQDWVKFWEWYHSPARKQSKPKGVQPERMYTDEPQAFQTRDEVEELKVRLAELEARFKEKEGELTEAKTKVERLETKLTEATARILKLQPLELKISGLESTIRDMGSELLNRPYPQDLIRRKVAELGMQEPLMQHQQDSKKAVRYWALAKLLESLE